MSKRSYEEWLAWVEAQPDQAFGLHHGESIMIAYSGFDEVNRNFALRECQSNSAYPACYIIDHTEAGIELLHHDLYDTEASGLTKEQAHEVWRATSIRFAENARGEVQTHVIDAREDRIFRETELPIFLENEQVTSINGIPREQLRQLLDHTLAYEQICAAELARDQERAQESGEPYATMVAWKLLAEQQRALEREQDFGRDR